MKQERFFYGAFGSSLDTTIFESKVCRDLKADENFKQNQNLN